MKRIFFKIVFFLLLTYNAVAQNDIYVQNLSIQEGLSQTYVNVIYQDKFGFLWIGTQDGLNKYDGRSFHTYRYEPLDTNSISNSNIQSIAQDADGNLWVATSEGLNYFNRYTTNFKEFKLNNNYQKSVEVFYVFVDSSGYIWCKTYSEIVRIDPKTEEIVKLPYNLIDFSNANKDSPIYEDSNGTIWIATNDGLIFTDRKRMLPNVLKHHKDNPNSLNSNEVHALKEDDKGNLLIGTANGFCIYNIKKKSFKRYLYSQPDEQPIIVNGIIYDNGNIWLSTPRKFGIFDRENDKIIDNKYLSSIRRISGCLMDRSGIFWLSSYNGIFKVDTKNQKFNHYFDAAFAQKNNTSSQIRSIHIENGKIWVGTKDAGLAIFNRETNAIERVYHYKSKKYPIIDNSVEAIFADSRNDIWLGTEKGLMKYNKNDKQFIDFHDILETQKEELDNKWVGAICEDKHKNLWIGTRTNGVYKYAGKRLTNYANEYNDTSSLSSSTVYCLLEDNEGSIWVGTSSGLNRINPITGKIKKYYKNIENRKGLSNNLIISICQTSDSIIWLGTEAGLNRLNIINDHIQIYTQNGGVLKNDFIYEIVNDNNRYLWLSTNRGLIKFDTKTETSTHYDQSDGIQDYEYNIGAKCKSEKGELFFGGINGFNAFFPDSVTPNKHAPKVIISKMEYRNNNNQRKVKIIEAVDEVELEYNDFDFRIDFAMLEFSNPEANKYQYRFNHLSDDWISLGNKNYVEFTDLSPGEYLFEVKGANSDNVWAEETTKLKINVKAPIWNNIYAFIFYGLVFISFAIWITLRFTRNLRRTNQILLEKQKVAQEIETQKEELSIVHKNLTDSIYYAKRIIVAMMPNEKMLKMFFTESFVLAKPKDIVSGDFYWITERDDLIFLAVVDCTGHGVPGAFMSIIGFDLLRNIVEDLRVNDPSEIMEMLNNGVSKTLGRDDESSVRDGMDMVLVVVNKQEQKLEYSGAFNPFLMIRDNNISTIDGDRVSIGAAPVSEGFRFKKHVVKLQKDDIIYLFSDGYTDQFGGSDGKKFKRRRFRYLLLNIHREPIQKQRDILDNTINDWKGDLEQVDDIIVVGFRPLT